MITEELVELTKWILNKKTERQDLEIKAAHGGCPKRLYDTLSSFSNQDDGGTILFGVDETLDFEQVGVYDAQDLMKHVTEQCNQMSPVVRPVFTVFEQSSHVFVTAEIPGVDLSERPCYYAGKGRIKGSYIRVGDADEPMTEYEIYSYEAYRKKYQDDVRPVERAAMTALDQGRLEAFLHKLKANKPNLMQMDEEIVCELFSMTRNGVPTLAAVELFGLYPQAFFPQLCLTAVSIPGTELGAVTETGERFLDNLKAEGTLSQMLEAALAFVRRNTKRSTIIDPQTGKRADKEEYPMVAVREAILNALVHRDYSIHTEGMPIQVLLYQDRLEIRNPGGLYGRIRLNQLGKIQPDTRNPVIVMAMETLDETENRYSGIPTMRQELAKAGLPEPEFREERGSFVVCFRKKTDAAPEATAGSTAGLSGDEAALLHFCETPRTRKELAEYLGLDSVSYAIKRHVMPLVELGLLRMELPDTPKSPRQRFVRVL